ncbi:hypothetical protein GZ112_13570 [Staphylococcus aureus]|nr:hypothetical protein [Staphylococcus aureus]
MSILKLFLDINANFKVATLLDLPKIKIAMKNVNIRINKSKSALKARYS